LSVPDLALIVHRLAGETAHAVHSILLYHSDAVLLSVFLTSTPVVAVFIVGIATSLRR
jgi:hypothetical protein